MVIDRFIPEGKRPYWRLEAEGRAAVCEKTARGRTSRKENAARLYNGMKWGSYVRVSDLNTTRDQRNVN